MSKKSTHLARTARAHALAAALTELGFEPTLIDADCVIASGKTLNVWCDFRYDHIHFGKAATFNRWATSRDYVFEGIQDDKDDLALVLRIAEDCVAKGVARGDDFEPIVLNQWWRQYKRQARLEEASRTDASREGGVAEPEALSQAA